MQGFISNSQPEENPHKDLEIIASKGLLNSMLVSELGKEKQWNQDHKKLRDLAHNFESCAKQIRSLIPVRAYTLNSQVLEDGIALLHELKELRNPKNPKHKLANEMIVGFSRRVRKSNPLEIYICAMTNWLHLSNAELLMVIFSLASLTQTYWPTSFQECCSIVCGCDLQNWWRVSQRIRSDKGIGKLVRISKDSSLKPSILLQKWSAGQIPLDDIQRDLMLKQIPVKDEVKCKKKQRRNKK
jgi:hypothetical protein